MVPTHQGFKAQLDKEIGNPARQCQRTQTFRLADLKSAKCEFESDWGNGVCAGNGSMNAAGGRMITLGPGITPASGVEPEPLANAAEHRLPSRTGPGRVVDYASPPWAATLDSNSHQ
jgi:hypothetical protein